MRQGRSALTLDLGGGPASLSLNSSLADNMWHRIDLVWKDQGRCGGPWLVEMMVDLCLRGSWDQPPASSPAVHYHTSDPVLPDLHACRGSARLVPHARVLTTTGVLQVGGVAHPAAVPTVAGLHRPPPHLTGCIRNLRVNGRLVDLGEGVLSRASTPRCPAADCLTTHLQCGLHGRCQGSPESLRCECLPGWGGQGCASPTTPTTFLHNSYVKLALSFSSLAYTTSITLRSRGVLVVLSSQHGQDVWFLQLLGGHLCAVLHLHSKSAATLCLSQATLTDGRWHALAAHSLQSKYAKIDLSSGFVMQRLRYGSATLLSVDDGDGDLYNASQLLDVDKQEGVRVGSAPYSQYAGLKIHGNYFDGCIDDLRISGHSAPLPPTVNSTLWGQASVFKGVERGCVAPSACTNVSCRQLLSCIETWSLGKTQGLHSRDLEKESRRRRCGEGRVLSRSRLTCEDEDECAWQPCLSCGSCFNTQPGDVSWMQRCRYGSYFNIGRLTDATQITRVTLSPPPMTSQLISAFRLVKPVLRDMSHARMRGSAHIRWTITNNAFHAGYVCSCPAGFSRQHCHLPEEGHTSLKLPVALLVTIVVWCMFLVREYLLHLESETFHIVGQYISNVHPWWQCWCVRSCSTTAAALRRGITNPKTPAVDCKGRVSASCGHTPNLLELQLLKPLRANSQPAWARNPNIAGRPCSASHHSPGG
ncbi:Neural-cadherin [Chionoecetes opilio]|uniref:Neural-cadherin n=1 Tax=Chionoecetes opilio TaxID=41210 RepID=A0A8J4Y8T9_CHIOP|nr:Neural-cadherin [Chionoecetes opilio]